ncbi:MAG: mechanosensitive ion channel [Alphaproteobacteria bacterium]|nr:mechanosensitive ion channel [Alphaproteobacteria bacterium]
MSDPQPKSNLVRRILLWALFFVLVAVLGAGVAGWLDPVRNFLEQESLTFTVGSFQASAYDLARVIVVLALVYWIAAVIAGVLDQRVQTAKGLKPGTRNLIAQIVRIAIYIVAGLITMDVIGLDLTALTVFSGALGIGLGFGLQKVASNFVSGLILTIERSIEIGDMVELPDGTAGFVRSVSGRYMLLETFDGREILVPNEDLITGRVINWTLHNTRGRVEIRIGVAYGTDLHLARRIMLEAATSHPACLAEPAPMCVLQNFGDSAIEFQLFFWVGDVTLGRLEPKSEVMFAIVDAFKANAITIPFPQRDVHMVSGASSNSGGET